MSGLLQFIELTPEQLLERLKAKRRRLADDLRSKLEAVRAAEQRLIEAEQAEIVAERELTDARKAAFPNPERSTEVSRAEWNLENIRGRIRNARNAIEAARENLKETEQICHLHTQALQHIL